MFSLRLLTALLAATAVAVTLGAAAHGSRSAATDAQKRKSSSSLNAGLCGTAAHLHAAGLGSGGREGILLGSGTTGVVVVPPAGSTPCAWVSRHAGLLGLLAAHDARVLVVGTPAATEGHAAVRRGAAELRKRGARRLVLLGESLGGLAVVAAARSVEPVPTAVISVSGSAAALSGKAARAGLFSQAMATMTRRGSPILLVTAKNDAEALASAKRLYRSSVGPGRQLLVVPGPGRGLLDDRRASAAGQVQQRVLAFVQRHTVTTSGRTPGIGVDRLGNSYATGSGYDRYSYVTVGSGDAAKIGAVNTMGLVYTSGTDIPTTFTAGVAYSIALAKNWLLRSSSGSYLMSGTGGKTYVGDFGNPAYQQAFVSWATSFLSQTHAKGIEIDDALCDATFLTGGVYPAKYPNQKAWEDGQVSFINYVGDQLKAKGYYVLTSAVCYIPGNLGSDSGATTAAFWSRMAPHVSGLKSEYWMQTSNNISILRAEGTGNWTWNWSGWENLITVAQNAGADFFTEMYGTTTTTTNIMRYGRGSFLLGWNGKGGAFEYTPDNGSTDPWNPEWTMDIGTPTGARYKVGSGWRRDFTGGTVILNPAPSASQAFPLGATYYRPDGSSLTSATLGPTQALILRTGS